MRFLLPLLILVFIGCRSACPPGDSKFFPIGIFDVPQTDLAQVKAAGFNLVIASATPEYLDSARSHELKVLSHSRPFQVLTETAAADRVRRLDSHPALWGWYSIDEPDRNRIPPKDVARVHEALERIAKKPTVLVLMSGSSAVTYGKYGDIIGIDFYPVPWAPISQFAKEMKLARYALGDKPYIAILQAFDWTAFRQLIETNQPLRAPAYEELRCMVYMALAHRAQGVLLYSFKAGEWDLSQTALWLDVKRIVREVNEFLPLFTARFRWWSPELEYLEGLDSSYNEVRDGKIILVLLEVDTGNNAVPAGRYVLAINTTADTVLFRVKLPHAALTVPVLGSSESLPLADGTLYRDFAPYEVLCLGPVGSPAQ